MNIVISTTIGWNIGDQFILSGVKRLLHDAWDDCHYVHHDRNPVKFPRGGEESHSAITCGWADALVIAGSPGWTTECSEIYCTAREKGVPVYLIGIGAGAPPDALALEVASNPNIIWVLSEAKMVICRDEITSDLARRYRSDVSLLPCPAAFALMQRQPSSEESFVALGPYYEGDWHTSGLLAHQMADLKQSDGAAFYSEDPLSYLSCYARAERVISSRLHASVVCRAHGVPVVNLWPQEDYRCAGTWAVLESFMRSGLSSPQGQYAELLAKYRPSREVRA